MNFTLHKLNEGFIVTSDEDILSYNGLKYLAYPDYSTVHIWDMKGIHKDKSVWVKPVIAQQDQIDFSALTEEEQKKIGWFNTEKLAYKDIEDNFGSNVTFIEGGLKWIEGFQIGFQKAQELLSDRMFTIEDIKNAWRQGYNEVNLDDHIDRLLKPKSWEIEAEMEVIPLSQKQGFNMGAMGSDFELKPKFTNNQLKITKIIS
jgi:hypothetical protein